MKLQDQVITLDQAKRLKELGVKQDSIWFWAYPVKEKMISTRKGIIHNTTCEDHDVAAAFTVAELGVMLPHPDGMGELGGFNHPSDFDPTAKDGKPWYCMWEYDTEKYGMKRQLFEGATEAEARAAILIFFLEINLIQVDELNARLCAE